MKYVFCVLFFVATNSVQAANLILAGFQDGNRKGERECGQIGVINVSDSNRASIISKDGNCVCNLERRLSVADTMELIRNDQRLSLICEASFDTLEEVGRPVEILLKPSATITAKNFRIVAVAQ